MKMSEERMKSWARLMMMKRMTFPIFRKLAAFQRPFQQCLCVPVG